MHKNPHRYLALLLLCLPWSAHAADDAYLDVSVGSRVDNLRWNIAGWLDGTSPNILSELTWSDLAIVQVRAAYETMGTAERGLYLRASVGGGLIVRGKNQDSDYAGDNRTLEFSRSNNSASNGSVVDMQVGVGARYAFAKRGVPRSVLVIPMAGVSYHAQNLRMTNGNQTLFDQTLCLTVDPECGVTPLGPFAGLNSSYDTTWTGPWFGLDMLVATGQGSEVFVRGEYHLVSYTAQANWNLRPEFAHPVSFEHEASGQGAVLSVGWRTLQRQGSGVTVSVDYQRWSTDPGTDTTYWADPNPPCYGRCYSLGRLNEVVWDSLALNVGLRW